MSLTMSAARSPCEGEAYCLCLQDAFVKNGALKSVMIFLIRFGNTFWGGAQWVQYAKLIGIQ